MSDLFYDEFMGGGTLSGRTPDTGGAYSLESHFFGAGGSLTAMALDGSGNLLPSSLAATPWPHARSLFTGVGATYSVDVKFTPGQLLESYINGHVYKNIPAFVTLDASLDFEISYNAGWFYSYTLTNSASSTIATNGAGAFSPDAGPNTFQFVIASDRITLFNNGNSLEVVMCTPDVIPNAVVLAYFADAAASPKQKLASVRIGDYVPYATPLFWTNFVLNAEEA